MDLFTLAARLLLDTSDYERALESAVQSSESHASQLSSIINGATSGISAAFGALSGDAPAWGIDLIDGFIGGIHSMLGALRRAVSDAAQLVRDYLGFSEPKLGPLSNFHTYAPDMMALFAGGIRDNAHLVTDRAAEAFDLAPVMAQAAASPVPGIPRAETRPVQVVFEFDGVQKWVYNLTQAEEQRVGVKLSRSVM